MAILPLKVSCVLDQPSATTEYTSLTQKRLHLDTQHYGTLKPYPRLPRTCQYLCPCLNQIRTCRRHCTTISVGFRQKGTNGAKTIVHSILTSKTTKQHGIDVSDIVQTFSQSSQHQRPSVEDSLTQTKSR